MSRRRKPYSPAYAIRQLARIAAQQAVWKATDTTGDWRKQADKARALASLECQEAKWRGVLAPEPVRGFYSLPF